MKTIKFVSLIVLLQILFCCNSDKEEYHETELNVENLSVRINSKGCDSKKTVEEIESLAYVDYEFQGKSIKFVRRINLNCGTDSIGIQLLDSNKNTLIIKEFEYYDNAAYCTCNFDYDYTIGEFENGNYNIIIISPKRDTISLYIGFSK